MRGMLLAAPILPEAFYAMWQGWLFFSAAAASIRLQRREVAWGAYSAGDDVVMRAILLSGGSAWVFVKAVTILFGLIALSRLLPGPNRQVPGYRPRPLRQRSATAEPSSPQGH